ncbi:DUF370 domain-containing protein [Bacillus aerolatus]|uniref:DUF370 domain-containing protein n=1 Tax=Bacillus aerolatus TaxID=2653354 RepID=A0A6I1FH91_9BACI|nr:extracellular matrix/biofilm biosynthesis regulator RemA family protein [Bacillus aerolatus]KAB7707636.1 DUF370 domain-containing protein [Bacillus aerolatus]
MYVQISETAILRTNEIIAIIDQNSTDLSEKNAANKVHKDSLALLANGGYKSVVVTGDHFYLSPFSSHTLKKRIYENHLQKSGG